MEEEQWNTILGNTHSEIAHVLQDLEKYMIKAQTQTSLGAMLQKDLKNEVPDSVLTQLPPTEPIGLPGAFNETLHHCKLACDLLKGSTAVHLERWRLLLQAGRSYETLLLVDSFLLNCEEAELSDYTYFSEILQVESVRLFVMNNVCGCELSCEEVFEAHKKWGDKMIARHASLRRHSWGAPRDAERRLKIGYVSPDLLSTHTVARFTPSPRLNPKPFTLNPKP